MYGDYPKNMHKILQSSGLMRDKFSWTTKIEATGFDKWPLNIILFVTWLRSWENEIYFEQFVPITAICENNSPVTKKPKIIQDTHFSHSESVYASFGNAVTLVTMEKV